MADEIIGAKVQVEGGAAIKTIGELRKEIKEANAELLNAQRNFGDYSEQALAAAKKLAQLKDSIQEARETADLFDPGQKFQAFSGALQSITGGFAAVQGAMGLLGVESKEVEAQLLKVQSALALSQGLSTITDSWKDFQRLGAIIKTNLISAFTALRTAIGATGIGLLVVAVGLLYANFDKLKKVATDMFPALKNTGKLLNDIKQVAVGVGNAIVQYLLTPLRSAVQLIQGDFKGAINEIKKGYNVIDNYKKGRDQEAARQEENYQKERLKMLIKANEDNIAVMKARGESTYQYERLNLDLKKKLLKEDGEALQEAQQEEKLLIASHEKDLAEKKKTADAKAEQSRQAAAAKAKADADKAAAERKQNLEAALQAENDIRKDNYVRGLNEEEKAQAELWLKYLSRIQLIKKAGRDTSEAIAAYEEESLAIYKEYRKKEVEAKREAERQKREDELATSAFTRSLYENALQEFLEFADNEKLGLEIRLANIQEFNRQVLADIDLTESDRTLLEKLNAEARKEIAEKEAAAKHMLAQGTASVLENLSQIVGEQTVAGKALAIAGATIATFESAVLAYRNGQMLGGPWGIAAGIAAAAAAVAAGVIKIKSIAAVKIPGKSSGGSVPNLSGSGGGTAPSLSTTSINSAPVTPLMASGGSGMNDMLGQMRTTQEKNNKTLEDLNATLKGGLRANIMEGDIKSTNNRTASIEAASKL